MPGARWHAPSPPRRRLIRKKKKAAHVVAGAPPPPPPVGLLGWEKTPPPWAMAISCCPSCCRSCCPSRYHVYGYTEMGAGLWSQPLEIRLGRRRVPRRALSASRNLTTDVPLWGAGAARDARSAAGGRAPGPVATPLRRRAARRLARRTQTSAALDGWDFGRGFGRLGLAARERVWPLGRGI